MNSNEQLKKRIAALESEKASYADLMSGDADRIINDIEALKEASKKLQQCLAEISNMCIGEITMGYRLDAEHIGQLIYAATGKTNPELNHL